MSIIRFSFSYLFLVSFSLQLFNKYSIVCSLGLRTYCLICFSFRFDNFLNVKCPDDAVLRTVIRSPWWQRPTSVHGETDPRIAGTMPHELSNDNISSYENNIPFFSTIAWSSFMKYITEILSLAKNIF